MAHLEIALLGHFAVTVDGRPLTRFGTDKARALLAYLVVEADRDHRRAMLAGLLWPDVPEATAHHNLSQALLLLRQTLGEKAASSSSETPFLLTTWQTLRFNPESDYTLDVAAFQAGVAVCTRGAPERLTPADVLTMTQALERYRGEFLSDPWQVNSQAFEEWLLFKQTQLHVQAVDALDCLGQYHEQRGEFALAAAYARRHIALDPLREQAHRQLMLALALDGRRSEALAQYAACRALLAQELGIEPAPETTALYEQIRAGGAVGDRPQRRQPQREKPVTGPLASPPVFVGRTRELARLDAALELAAAGKGQIVFVTGAAGSGKTALLDAFARRGLAAHADLLVVNSSGNAYTGLGTPYWLFIEILRQLHSGAANGAALSLSQVHHLDMAHPGIVQSLAKAAPDLERFISGGRHTGGGSGLEQAGLFDQLTRALQAVASHHPLVIVLDDLQWADRNSLNLLFYLGRRLSGQRILIVGTFRSDVLDQGYASLAYLHEQDVGERHPLVALVHEVQRHLGDICIDLARAEGQDFIAALVDAEPNRLGAEFREILYRHTGGHALFTTELLRGMQERGDLVRDTQGYWVEGEQIAWSTLPAQVEAVIAERIGQLLPEWQAMLAVASVEGDEFTVQVLAHALDLPEAEVSRRLSGALSRHHYLVVPVGMQPVGARSLARYRFRHLLFQRYLYNQLDPVEQAHLHLTVGRALETLYAEHAYAISLPLARHFELGGVADKASAYLLAAGKRAAHLAAPEEALRLLTRGLDLLKRLAPSPEHAQQEAEVQLALGTALLSKGWSAPERAQAFERAYDLCQRAGATAQLAHSLLGLADIHLARGQCSQATAIGEQLLTLAQSTRDPLIAIFAHYVLGMTYFFMGQVHPARQHLEQAAALYARCADTLPDLAETDIGVRSMVWLGITLWGLGYAEQADDCIRQAVAGARALEHTFSLRFALSVGALSVCWLRYDLPALRAALRHLAALRSDASPDLFRPWSVIFQGWLAAVDDHDPESPTHMQQAIGQWEADDAQGGHALHHALLAQAYLALGQAEDARVTLEHALIQVAATGFRFFEAELLRLQGEALRLLDRPAEAEACFLHAIAVAQEQSAKAWELRAVLSPCRLRQAAGALAEFEAARQHLAALYAWFTEGLDTPDLQDAAALLAESEVTL